MSFERRSSLYALVAAALAVGAASAARAAYTFTNIIDSTMDSSIGGNESIAIDGSTIAIHDGDEIFTMAAGVRTTIAKLGDAASTGTIDSFDSHNGIDVSGGNVAFTARYAPLSIGVFRGSGGPLTTIAKKFDATPAGQINILSRESRVSIHGEAVAFSAQALRSGVFVGSGGPISTIAATPMVGGPSIDPLQVGPDLSGNRAAFFGQDEMGAHAIFAGDGSALTKIAKIGDAGRGGSFYELGNPQISGAMVAFSAKHGAAGQGIYLGDGGPLTTVVITGDIIIPNGGPITSLFLGGVANGGQQVAFLAESGSSGAFVRDRGVTATVIKSSDPLFAQRLAGLPGSQIVIDPQGSGRVAFGYQLTNGVRGIALATPVPEPGSAVAIATLCAAFAVFRRAPRQPAA
jgi:hypothetical protein